MEMTPNSHRSYFYAFDMELYMHIHTNYVYNYARLYTTYMVYHRLPTIYNVLCTLYSILCNDLHENKDKHMVLQSKTDDLETNVWFCYVSPMSWKQIYGFA